MISIKAKPVGWVLSEVLNKMYGNVRTSSYKNNNLMSFTGGVGAGLGRVSNRVKKKKKKKRV